jgi:hypothetical protein
MESKPFNISSLVMKSMFITSKERAFGVTVIGFSGALKTFVYGLVLWQITHPLHIWLHLISLLAASSLLLAWKTCTNFQGVLLGKNCDKGLSPPSLGHYFLQQQCSSLFAKFHLGILAHISCPVPWFLPYAISGHVIWFDWFLRHLWHLWILLYLTVVSVAVCWLLGSLVT